MTTETQDSGSMTQTLIWLGAMLIGVVVVGYFYIERHASGELAGPCLDQRCGRQSICRPNNFGPLAHQDIAP